VAIKEHAFVTSDFPLILSMENHCSPIQQEVVSYTFPLRLSLVPAPCTSPLRLPSLITNAYLFT
jgi:hypothetical protein